MLNIEQAHRPHSGVEWHFTCSMRSKWRHRAGISALQPHGTPFALLDELHEELSQGRHLPCSICTKDDEDFHLRASAALLRRPSASDGRYYVWLAVEKSPACHSCIDFYCAASGYLNNGDGPFHCLLLFQKEQEEYLFPGVRSISL